MYVLIALAWRFGMGLIGPLLVYNLYIKALLSIAFLIVKIAIHKMEQ